MGKSTASCFKIITCANTDSVDHDDLQAPESKGSSGRGWSFRKRSARHRVLSNTVISESPSSVIKESSESTPVAFQSQANKEVSGVRSVTFQPQPTLTVPEKTSAVHITEDKIEVCTKADPAITDAKEYMKPVLEISDAKVCTEPELEISNAKVSTEPEPEISDATVSTEPEPEISDAMVSTEPEPEISDAKVSTKPDPDISVAKVSTKPNPDISDAKDPEPQISDKEAAGVDSCEAVVEESNAIVIQEKNVIKLQAAVRGHIVRKHAVGTLRCVQAIVKMQTLVRAHQLSESIGSHNPKQGFSSKRRVKPPVAPTYISIDKLLGNRFARQLMASTPRNDPINIKCDPLKSDSAWKWLERWMSAAESPSNEEPQDSGVAEMLHENKNILECSDHQAEISVQSDCDPESTSLLSGEDALAKSPANDDIFIANDDSNLDHHSSKSIASGPTDTIPHGIDESHSTYVVQEFSPTETKEREAVVDLESESLLNEAEIGNDSDTLDSRCDLSETEVKKFSRKISNPSFIAAQSKFEELTSASSSAKQTTSSSIDNGVESCLDKVSSSADQNFSPKAIELAENSISNVSGIQIGGSECGTELSISSTLDSPDVSEMEVNQLEQEPKLLDLAEHSINGEKSGVEANGDCIMSEADTVDTNTHQLDRCETVNSVTGELERYESLKSDTGEPETYDTVDSVMGENARPSVAGASPLQPPKEPEVNPSDLNVELGSKESNPVGQLSPEASPRSHMTIPESQATPSSQVSVKSKKSKGEKSGPSHKKKSSSADRKSLSNKDSGSRSSMEQKEQKTGKRRNSIGSAKPDTDQEPRDSSSSISVPSYMQATESARAKALAGSSPRSSPDVHDKDTTLKKRHSLPGGNGRHGSPRIQRSLSQAQQNAKGNGPESPQGVSERKWRR